MSCVLRAAGRDFDVDAFLAGSTLKPLIVYQRGQERFPGSKIEERSGMNVSVSEREFSDLAGQIEDAIQFLAENANELTRLRAHTGVERVELDFPVVDRDVAAQSDVFPAALLSEMGNLQIALIVSRYPPSS
jgi:hypothetical protein